MNNKYSAIYYPDSYIHDQKSLMTYLFIYDEIHLVTFSDDSRNPTQYLKNIPDHTQISSMTKSGKRDFFISGNEVRSNITGGFDENTKQVIQFYQFVQRYKGFIG